MSDNQTPETDARSKLLSVRMLAMDVDGVLTDGGIIYPDSDSETKRFHVADGLGIQLLLMAGIKVVWISGRKSEVVERRARELGVTTLYQGQANKAAALTEMMGKYTLTSANIAYIGDDLNDIPAYRMAGVRIAPANAAIAIKGNADFVTAHAGGDGAVREVCDMILHTQNLWAGAVEAYLTRLIAVP